MPIPTEYLTKFTVCTTRSDRRKHWGYRISAQHPLARAGHPVGALAPHCLPPAYAVPAEPISADNDLEGCRWCIRFGYVFDGGH